VSAVLGSLEVKLAACVMGGPLEGDAIVSEAGVATRVAGAGETVSTPPTPERLSGFPPGEAPKVLVTPMGMKPAADVDSVALNVATIPLASTFAFIPDKMQV